MHNKSRKAISCLAAVVISISFASPRSYARNPEPEPQPQTTYPSYPTYCYVYEQSPSESYSSQHRRVYTEIFSSPQQTDNETPWRAYAKNILQIKGWANCVIDEKNGRANAMEQDRKNGYNVTVTDWKPS